MTEIIIKIFGVIFLSWLAFSFYKANKELKGFIINNKPCAPHFLKYIYPFFIFIFIFVLACGALINLFSLMLNLN